MRKTVCPTCQSTELTEVPMASGPHHAKLVCRNRHFVQWLPAPRGGDSEIPEDLRPLITARAKPANLRGTEKQCALARSLRSNMVSFANKAGREDYTRLLVCVEDATWFLANKGLFPPEVRWPRPEQMAAVAEAGARK